MLCFEILKLIVCFVLQNDFRNPELPLARIKKIMKLDEDVKVIFNAAVILTFYLSGSFPFQMISGEAPVLFSKAVEMFIAELSLRAWVNTEDNKRRTLQRNDIAMGISKYDQFDFLIDIVPREEAKPQNPAKKSEVGIPNMSVISQDQLNYFLLAQQQQQLQSAAAGQPIQIIQAPGQGQSFSISPQVFQLPVQNASASQSQDNSSAPTVISAPQVVQLNHNNTAGSQSTNGEPKQTGLAATSSGPIILSNVQYGNGGEVVSQPMPISLNSQQLQALLSQNANQTGNTPIIINPMPQFITNAGQMMQAIIPTTTGNLEQQQQGSSSKSQREQVQS